MGTFDWFTGGLRSTSPALRHGRWVKSRGNSLSLLPIQANTRPSSRSWCATQRRLWRLMQSRAFERSAGYTALLVGIVGFLYSVSFVLISRSNAAYGNALAATFLLAGGVLAIQALAAVYRRLRDVDVGFALVGFM